MAIILKISSNQNKQQRKEVLSIFVRAISFSPNVNQSRLVAEASLISSDKYKSVAIKTSRFVRKNAAFKGYHPIIDKSSSRGVRGHERRNLLCHSKCASK